MNKYGPSFFVIKSDTKQNNSFKTEDVLKKPVQKFHVKLVSRIEEQHCS